MKGENFNRLKDFIELYKRKGFCLIPIKFGSKKPNEKLLPNGKWKEFQTRKPTEEELQRWFGEGKGNIAVVCGEISGNLIVLDFENKASFYKFIGFLEEINKELTNTWVVKTGKGFHVYYKAKNPLLCMHWGKEKFISKEIEIKGDSKHYVLLPPSLHPDGCRYTFVVDPFETEIKSIRLGEFKDILQALVEAKCISEDERKRILNDIYEEIRKTIEERKKRFLKRIIDGKPIKFEYEQIQVSDDVFLEELRNIEEYIVKGVRSDWLFVTTMYLKLKGYSEQEAFQILLKYKPFKEKIIRKGWTEERGFEWWKRYEWDDIGVANVNGLIGAIKEAEKITKKVTSKEINFLEKVENFIRGSVKVSYWDKKAFEQLRDDILYSLYKIREKNDGKIEYVFDWDSAVRFVDGLYRFAYIMELDELYYYKNGVYIANGEIIVKRTITRLVDFLKDNGYDVPYPTTHKVNEIIDKIKSRNVYRIRDFDRDKYIINFKNCLVKIDPENFTYEVLPHTSEYLSLIQYNAEFKEPEEISKEAKQLVEGFFNTTFEENQRKLIEELMGYCFLRDYRFQYVFMLFGIGANGKGTFLTFLRNILGSDNYSSNSLSELDPDKDKFGAADLFMKSANICGDADKREVLENTRLIKSLTGGDAIRAQFKYKKAFKFVNFAKLIFAVNELPMLNDFTYANMRRWIIIHFKRQFRGNDAIKNLGELLSQPECLAYGAWLAINGLLRLLKRGDFEKPDEDEELKQRWFNINNPINSFVNKHLVITGNEKDWLLRDDVFAEFNKYCESIGLEINIDKGAFTRKLAAYGIKVGDKWVRGKKERVYIGVKWKDKENDNEDKTLTDFDNGEPPEQPPKEEKPKEEKEEKEPTTWNILGEEKVVEEEDEKKSSEKIDVRFLANVKVKIDDREYEFVKEECANIPKGIAEELISKGLAEPLRSSEIENKELLDMCIEKVKEMVKRDTIELGYSRYEEIEDRLGSGLKPFLDKALKKLEEMGVIYRTDKGWRYVG